MLSRVIINAVFGLFVFLVGATVVNAAAIGVSPVRVTLSDKQKIGTITLRNDGTDPVPMQLEALKWSKEEGEDVFTSTRELIVSPPIFTIPAGGSQLLRVGLRGAPDAKRELAYRIFLQELPPPPSPDFNGAKMLMRVSLPVFVLPKVAANPLLRWQAVRTSDGSLNFSLSKPGSAQPWISQKASDYALIGQSLDWILPASADYSIPKSGTTIQLFAETDAGDIEAEVLVLP
jgi:fimbrial chaperone protein